MEQTIDFTVLPQDTEVFVKVEQDPNNKCFLKGKFVVQFGGATDNPGDVLINTEHNTFWAKPNAVFLELPQDGVLPVQIVRDVI